MKSSKENIRTIAISKPIQNHIWWRLTIVKYSRNAVNTDLLNYWVQE